MSATAAVDPHAPMRVSIRVPASFDPDKHVSKVLARIERDHGPGFRIDSFNKAALEVVAVREGTLAQFSELNGTVRVLLPKGVAKGEGPKLAEEYENLKKGWKVTRFEPYAKPGYAVMAQLTDAEVRVRDAVAAAVGSQRTPWDVQIASRDDGGFDLALPSSYTPTRHDAKLLEVAETAAGEPGWYCKIDPKTLTGAILPGELPTFPTMIPYPFDRKVPRFTNPSDTSWVKVPIGRSLGHAGAAEGSEFSLDLKAAGHTLLQGTPGSGKSVNINAALRWLIKVGAKIAITDTPDKCVDFLWAQPYVMDGGWGCDTYQEMVTTSELVYAEGKRRAEILKRKGLNNWFDITDDSSFVPLFYIVDEYTGLMSKTPEPKSLDKEHPKRVKINEENALKDMLNINVQRIILEMRFAGIFVLMSTQVGNTTTGVSTAVKNGCGNRLLMGARASDRQRANAFNDPDSVPMVPENVRSDGMVAKGVGCGEFEGQPTTIFKGYYASPRQFEADVKADPTLRITERPRPTAAEIARFLGDMDEGASTDPFGDREAPTEAAYSGPGATGRGGAASTSEGMRLAREQGLQGAAAANFAGRYDEAVAAKRKRSQAKAPDRAALCGSCSKPIDPNGDCGCSR